MIKPIIELSLSEAYSLENPLRKISSPITEFNNELMQVIQDIEDTFYNTERGVGIAAPQLGIYKRIVLVHLDRKSGSKNHIIVINPRIISQCGEEEEYLEGCLSIMPYKGLVPRKLDLKLEYTDISGTKQNIETSGFHSRIFLHELDHLDGILFIDRMRSDEKPKRVVT